MVWVVRAKLKDDYKVFMEFNDGVSGIIDFREKLIKGEKKKNA